MRIFRFLLLVLFSSITPVYCVAAEADNHGLIGHWPLDGVAAAVARDASANGHHGTVHGAVVAEGPSGRCLQFDGEDDFVALGDLGSHAAVTIAFWVQVDGDAPAGQFRGLVSSDAWEKGVFHIPMLEQRVDIYLHLGDSRRGRLTSPRLRSDRWYHLAVTADTVKRSIALFLNGTEVDRCQIPPLANGIKLAEQVVGREFNGRYFRGAIDDVRIYSRALGGAEIRALCPDAKPPEGRDPRDLRTGLPIPDEGYCDQPYTVITHDGNWLCTMTTGPGREGERGQHIVALISADRGRTWSEPIDIEPSDGPEASWAMPLVADSGRVYVFYTYNGENLREWEGKPIRTDTVGWYCYKYSDDHGRTWSKQRYRLPLPIAPVDQSNTFGGQHQMFWGIGKPITHGDTAWFAFSRVGQLVVDKSEGWFYRSDNVLSEPDPAKVRWDLLPDGEHGLKDLKYGDVHAEQNLVALDDGSLYCMYRTKIGYPFHSYSRDGGHTWTAPAAATYSPGGRKMKTPRACPRIWRTKAGRFLFWYHNHSDASGGGWTKRNPAWISGGVERDGKIHWSQPEILLYDPDPAVRTSYPDLIEQDGRYWITETQKTVARVHAIDPTLLEGLWNQGIERGIAGKGLILEASQEQLKKRGGIELTEQIDLGEIPGLAIDVWVRLQKLEPGQVLLDSRTADGRGWAMMTTPDGTLHIELSDGRSTASWDCDRGVLAAERLHHVVAVVDPGPRIISFVVDGVLCDGGEARTHGWGRFANDLGNVTGTGTLQVAPNCDAELKSLRLYGRYLRTSEAAAHYHTGSSATAEDGETKPRSGDRK
jgi:hypothetical protein